MKKTLNLKVSGLILLSMNLVPFSCAGEIPEPPLPNGNDSIKSIEEYRLLRTAKLNSPREVIHNNDGCDAIYFPINEPYSVQNLLDKCTAGLIGTGVRTISYCPTASGFGNFSYNTKVGEILVRHGYEFGIRPDARNITAEMIAEGTDPFKANVEFARKNGFEIFWSNRMNDTHDMVHRKEKPHFLWTQFKEDHPQYLFGSIGEKLPYGRWSSVDFEHEAVRDLCVRFYEEVCTNYDVDGVELDFLRHFELFKTVSRGAYATQEQLDLLTDMVRRIRRVTEEAGMRRGNPILVLVRIPTSVEYARKAGVDIEKWIDEGLVDIVVGSCYFRLDFWKNFVKLGKGRNVKMYAGVSETRVKDEHPRLVRQQNAVFRARAAAAWEAGVDGMYIFNSNSRIKFVSQIGSPQKLRTMNNLYFVTYRDGNPNADLKSGDSHFKMPRLAPSPRLHRKFNTGPFEFDIEIGDESAPSQAFAVIYTDTESVKAGLIVKINGCEATCKNVTEDGLSVFAVDASKVKAGINTFYIARRGMPNDNHELKDAALFFCRNWNDEDFKLKRLLAICR